MAKMGKKAMFCTACGSTSVSVFYPTPQPVARRVIEAASATSPRAPPPCPLRRRAGPRGGSDARVGLVGGVPA